MFDVMCQAWVVSITDAHKNVYLKVCKQTYTLNKGYWK